MYKQMVVAPWIEYIEEKLLKNENMKSKPNISKSKPLLDRLKEADMYSLSTAGAARTVADPIMLSA